MNSRQLTNIVLFALTLLTFACASKKEEASDDAADQKEWKEMDEFHMIMAETFHPYKDSANLEPAKTRAGELATGADKWASAALPEKVNNDEMKSKLEQLKTETTSFLQIVSTNDEKAIGDELTKIHDLFHSIQEDWYGGGEGHEHH
jgi:hypothetical protein